MNFYRPVAMAATILVIFTGGIVLPANSEEQSPHWSYEGKTGPESWGSLSDQWTVCKTGKSQSPIDIDKPASGEAPKEKIEISKGDQSAEMLNNGHTIQVNEAGADSLTIDDKQFQLVQYHFHSPSEHTIHGKHFPMEMHLVHKSKDGQLAVIGVLMEEGKHNAALDPFWSKLPASPDEKTRLDHLAANVDQLLPSLKTTYSYDGSLTTPPCSEGVKWVVMTTPIQLSKDQIAAFQKIIHENSRPVQPLNGRKVVAGSVSFE